MPGTGYQNRSKIASDSIDRAMASSRIQSSKQGNPQISITKPAANFQNKMRSSK